MLSEIKSLISHDQITENELLKILKEDAKKVDISDLVQSNLHL